MAQVTENLAGKMRGVAATFWLVPKGACREEDGCRGREREREGSSLPHSACGVAGSIVGRGMMDVDCLGHLLQWKIDSNILCVLGHFHGHSHPVPPLSPTSHTRTTECGHPSVGSSGWVSPYWSWCNLHYVTNQFSAGKSMAREAVQEGCLVIQNIQAMILRSSEQEEGDKGKKELFPWPEIYLLLFLNVFCFPLLLDAQLFFCVFFLVVWY